MASFSNWTTNPQLLLPQAADGVSITPDASSYVNSAYSQITAGLSSNIALCGLLVNNSTVVADYRVDVGTGASGSEIVAGTLMNQIETDASQSFLEFRTPIQVPASTRIALRMRKSGASTTAWFMKIVYYNIPTVIKNIAIDFTATADFAVNVSNAEQTPRPRRFAMHLPEWVWPYGSED